MKAELKSIYSPDIEDLENFQPDPPDNFSFLLELSVGPKGEMGKESFNLVVCTPQWLLSKHRKQDVVFGRHHIIVFSYDYKKIFSTLKNAIESIEGTNWNELGTKIGRIGKWEFEDYRD